MRENHLTVALTAVNLLAMGSASAAQATPVSDSDKVAADSLNAASRAAIEGSWLKLPTACKAREFNASPGESSTVAATDAQAIYAHFNRV